MADDSARPVVLFGVGPFASLVWYCLTHDSARDVAGFAVDAAFRDRDELHGLPVVDFETVEHRFPTNSHSMLVSISAQQANTLRRDRYLQAKAKGYGFATYVSSRAVVWPDLEIGENGIIFEGAIVQPFARIGVNTIIRSGCHISHHVTVADHCFLAPQACLAGSVHVGERCFIGVNATVRDGVRLGEGGFIAAGAVVTKDTEPDGLYMGTPARLSRRT